MATAPSLLKTEEVARLLRVHPKHVYRLLKRGLPARRVGSEWRFDRTDVMQWARQGSRNAPAEPGLERAELPAPAPPALAPPRPGAAPLIAANGDVVIVILLRQLQEAGMLLGFVQSDKETGVRHLDAGRVVATGCHAGGFPSHVGAERVARIHLVTREIGLVGRHGAGAPRLADLPRLRLASRPRSAGVREYLDGALRAGGADPDAVHARAILLGSHLDVACAVAAGHADAGLVSRAWGERLGLPFTPLAQEAYGLLVRARELGDPRVVKICEVAQGDRFRAQVGAVPGYDTTGAGDIRYDA